MLVWVYTCQNVTLLEITWRGSYISFRCLYGTCTVRRVAFIYMTVQSFVRRVAGFSIHVVPVNSFHIQCSCCSFVYYFLFLCNV